MKKTFESNIWEVWNEYAADNVFVDHKPTQSELREIVKKEMWHTNLDILKDDDLIDDFIGKWVDVDRMKVYTTTSSTVPDKRKKVRKVKCSHCNDTGIQLDDGYSTGPCPFCATKSKSPTKGTSQ
jgi:formylmethanofuran dehydrogenase subunit E